MYKDLLKKYTHFGYSDYPLLKEYKRNKKMIHRQVRRKMKQIKED